MSDVANKTTLANDLYEKGHFSTKKAALEAVNDLFENIRVKSMDDEMTVRISGFGIFKKKHKAARVAHNPANNEPVNVPEKDVLHFKASKVSAD